MSKYKIKLKKLVFIRVPMQYLVVAQKTDF